MPPKIYAPFERFNFSNKTCFLTGEPLSSEEEKIQVFPQWLMSRYGLEDKPFKLLDENIITYKDLKLPCQGTIHNAFLEPLEQEVAAAFNKGYEGIKQLDELKLFQWAGKLLYGIIFNEIQAGIRLMHAQGEEFSMSQSILLKFSQLHLLLQSINLPLIFEDFKPFSLFLFKVNNKPQEFGYRDEINTQTLALRVNDFGLLICLQDNSSNYYYHQKVYEQIKADTLHPIQFEEFSGRVFYSNYLFNRLPEYNILPVNNEIYIEEMPLRGLSSKPLFDEWQNKTYGQVLENFWKNWGFLLLEIIKNPEKPMSFLFDEAGNKIPAQSISFSL